MDYFQQFKRQKEINEGLFGNLFSKNKGVADTKEQHLKQYGFYKSDNGSFVFGSGNIAEKVNSGAHTVEAFLEGLDLTKNPRLNFLVLPGAKFHAKILNIDPSSQEVAYFQGDWDAGDFKGGVFEGVFRGNSFKGDFQGTNANYQIQTGKEIASFVDGTFLDSTNSGILGLSNTINTDNEEFNFITIPAGYSLRYVSKSGIEGYVKVLKRLDGVNSTFHYEILDGFVGQQTPQTIAKNWQYFRENSATGIFDINIKASTNIGGLIQVPAGDSIVEMYISSAPVVFKGPLTKFASGKQHVFSLTKLPYLNIKSIRGKNGKFVKPDVHLAFDSPEELQQLNYIESGKLKQDIKELSKAIKYGEVDGYGPFNFLSPLFNSNPGKKIFSLLKKPLAEVGGVMNNPQFNIPQDTDLKTRQKLTPKKPTSLEAPTSQFGTIPSMYRLNDFIRYFVENIVDKNGEPDEESQNLIISRLKTALGTDKEIIPEPASPQPGAQNIGKTSPKAAAKLDEAIRNEVRNIIKDNF